MYRFVYMLIGLTFFSSILLANRGLENSQEYRAAYVVPVTRIGLLKYALFSDLKAEIKSFENGFVKLEYSLPLELTGVENSIELKGVPVFQGETELQGNIGKGRCTGGVNIQRCEIVYSNLRFDHDLRLQVIAKLSNGDAKEMKERLEVAEGFEALVKGAELINRTVINEPQNALVTFSDSELHGVLEVLR